MSSVTAKLGSFVNETIARAKGDDVKAMAIKNKRKAEAAIKSELSSLDQAIISSEEALENAKEELGNAKFPTEPITNYKEYMKGVLAAVKNLEEAEDGLKDLEFSVKFQEDFLDEVRK